VNLRRKACCQVDAGQRERHNPKDMCPFVVSSRSLGLEAGTSLEAHVDLRDDQSAVQSYLLSKFPELLSASRVISWD
jgi:hypothetical protein